ncbi:MULTISPECIES: hypothetical protein [Priestia]|uniref:hypothetical protein n=1 Tax=Priestia TaxID=2800373 RepID=UPI0027E52D14|nr:hypothetical protein [Priestia aryabhattai]WJX02513.1 hypothetical protein P0182_29130 [Priestia aryabhattai]
MDNKKKVNRYKEGKSVININGTSGTGVNIRSYPSNNSGRIKGTSGTGVNIGSYSGNVVDIQLNMDMTPIAYAVGYLLHTNRKISHQELAQFAMNLKKLSQHINF